MTHLHRYKLREDHSHVLIERCYICKKISEYKKDKEGRIIDQARYLEENKVRFLQPSDSEYTKYYKIPGDRGDRATNKKQHG